MALEGRSENSWSPTGGSVAVCAAPPLLGALEQAATPAQTTLVYEAALKAGIARGAVEATSRPSCGILPASAKKEVISLSFGCRGNRTFTKLDDDEMYVSVPGSKWNDFVDRLVQVQRSNLTMGNYFQAQNAKFASPK